MSYHLAWTKFALALLLTFTLIEPLPARFIVGGQAFQQMFDRADLVVIATILKSKDTPERKKLIDIDAVQTTAPELLQDKVIGVETEFQTRLTLKGSKDVTKFVLHHYKLPVGTELENGPNFVETQRLGTFLMFLTKEKDGRYAPLTGQFDPAVLSVFEIKDATPDRPVR